MRGLATIAVIVATAMLTQHALAQTTPLPVEAFGNLPAITDAAISPDGTKLVYGSQVAGVPVISVLDLATNQLTPLARIANGQVSRAQLRGVDWADDGRVTFGLTETMRVAEVGGANDRADYFRPGVIDLAHPEVRFLTTEQQRERQRYHSGVALIAPIEGDPGFGRMVDVSYSFSPPRVIPFRVNLATGDARKAEVEGANVRTRRYTIDTHGDVVTRTDANSDTNHWAIYVYNDGHPTLLREGDSDVGATTSVLGVLHDGRLVLLDDKNDPSTLLAINRASGDSEVLFQHPGADVGVIRDPWTREIVGASWDDDHADAHYFDPDLQAAHDLAEQAFDGGKMDFTSWSRDRSRILILHEDGLDGGGYYLFTPAQHTMRLVAMLYPEVAAVDLGERQSITYRARDGARIPAYLTLPAGVDRHNMPLVLLVHGGPHGVRDDDGFDWWSAFLVSRGYAVLQPNYRGSGGYGHAWEDAGKLHWGDGVMQTDVEDGVAALVRSGMVDSARVCIVGASYGGYAALAGATITPDRYACAVSVSGPADLEAMMVHESERGGRGGESVDFWRHTIGDLSRDMDHIRATSPANLADHVHIPVLLIHGIDDIVVPYEQSALMERRLRAAGKNVRLVTLAHEDHWLSDGATRVEMLREIEGFLAQNIGRRPQH